MLLASRLSLTVPAASNVRSRNLISSDPNPTPPLLRRGCCRLQLRHSSSSRHNQSVILLREPQRPHEATEGFQETRDVSR